jgi:serine/threonine protein kinase
VSSLCVVNEYPSTQVLPIAALAPIGKSWRLTTRSVINQKKLSSRISIMGKFQGSVPLFWNQTASLLPFCRCRSEMKTDSYEYVRVDALVAERLTSSPRIYDIYGACGLGIISEFFPHGDMESVVVTGDGTMTAEKLHDGYELKPQNNLTAIEKLEIATQMAEALADLHGNKGGIIVHQDLQLSQYLWTADKSMVKLNDFNRAEFMLWDEEAQEYCRYREGRGNGSVSDHSVMTPCLVPADC